jgi:uncharacterized protein (DUF111 family)
VEAIAAVVLAETSTLGVRISNCERICLDRRWEEVMTEFGTIRIKIGEKEGKIVKAYPEYEDCKRAAAEHRVAIRLVHESALSCYNTRKS